MSGVLVDRDIIDARERGDIVITPWDVNNLGTNSYDVTLAPTLRTYKVEYERVSRPMNDDFYGSPPMLTSRPLPLDPRVPREVVEHRIPPQGFVLEPHKLYLAVTNEYTESHKHLPMLNGKSSIGRLGLSIHVTAGTGDVGFCGHWTMELFCIEPLRIYADMRIGQLLWFFANDPVLPYGQKRSAKYNNREAIPQASMMHLERGEKDRG